MEYNQLTDYVGVDINPETIETYWPELESIGCRPANRQHYGALLYGSFLLKTPDGIKLLTPYAFHKKWKFYNPNEADRTTMRTIVKR
jgi:hypothetical protein